MSLEIVFTCRELDTIKLLMEGATNKEIAMRLSLSEKTIKNRISCILYKLNLRNRTQVAIWAKTHGLDNKSQ